VGVSRGIALYSTLDKGLHPVARATYKYIFQVLVHRLSGLCNTIRIPNPLDLGLQAYEEFLGRW
jgi:hypothetical protein